MATRVGVFVDGENVGGHIAAALAAASERWGHDFRAADVGRAYAAWGDANRSRTRVEALGCGLELVDVPTGGKIRNAVDVQLAVDLVAEAHRPGLDVTLLVSGDTGFVSTARRVRSLGGHVYCAAVEGNFSTLLQKTCDGYLPLKEPRLAARTKRSTSLRPPATEFERFVFRVIEHALVACPSLSLTDLLSRLRDATATDALETIHGRRQHSEAVVDALDGTGWSVWTTGDQVMISDHQEMPTSAVPWPPGAGPERPRHRDGLPVWRGSDPTGDTGDEFSELDDLVADLLAAGPYRPVVLGRG